MSTADYQREWRARHGAKTGQIGRPESARCGTISGYQKHVRKYEPTCQECRTAWAAYLSNLRAAKSLTRQHCSSTISDTKRKGKHSE